MVDNKVSDKVVWEEGVTSDNDFTPTISQPQSAFQPMSQPQMMFCYKCNNVIPNNSTFCPYCQIKLFAECPKCGAKYSSQYPACSQCGTKREEYLRAQRREQERKEAIERENRHRQEILEREKREKERQEALERQRHEDYRKGLRETYRLQKEQILNTQEYQSTYSILKESLESWRRKHIMIIALSIIAFAIICVWMDNESLALMALPAGFGLSFSLVFTITRMLNVEKRGQYVVQYISDKGCYHDKNILAYVLKLMGNDSYKYTYDVLEDLSEWCIEAYGKQKRLSSFC